jgi:hypothetical protein
VTLNNSWYAIYVRRKTESSVARYLKEKGYDPERKTFVQA